MARGKNLVDPGEEKNPSTPPTCHLCSPEGTESRGLSSGDADAAGGKGAPAGVGPVMGSPTPSKLYS